MNESNRGIGSTLFANDIRVQCLVAGPILPQAELQTGSAFWKSIEKHDCFCKSIDYQKISDRQCNGNSMILLI